MTAFDEIRQLDQTIAYLQSKKRELELRVSAAKTTESLDELADTVSEMFGFGTVILKGKGRHRKVTNARAVFCYIAGRLGHTTVSTAKIINRHHTTVIYYRNHGFAERYRDYTEFRQPFDRLLSKYNIDKPSIN